MTRAGVQGVVFTVVCHGLSLEPFRLAFDGFGLVNLLFGVIEGDPFGVEISIFFPQPRQRLGRRDEAGYNEPRFAVAPVAPRIG